MKSGFLDEGRKALSIGEWDVKREAEYVVKTITGRLMLNQVGGTKPP